MNKINNSWFGNDTTSTRNLRGRQAVRQWVSLAWMHVGVCICFEKQYTHIPRRTDGPLCIDDFIRASWSSPPLYQCDCPAPYHTHTASKTIFINFELQVCHSELHWIRRNEIALCTISKSKLTRSSSYSRRSGPGPGPRRVSLWYSAVQFVCKSSRSMSHDIKTIFHCT